MIKTHEHSITTAIVVGVAYIFGVGLYALLIMVGFWAGREHAQAEYRYMKLKGINRSKLGFFDGFRREAWNSDSLVNDLIIPSVVGILIVIINIIVGGK